MRIALTALVLLVGCAKNVPQGKATGKDGKSKGARQIKFEEGSNEASAKGIVTYPGGDRVDWRFFEITKKGDIIVSLKWKPPRPGLDLSFNMTDEGFNPIEKGKAKPAKGSGKTKKKVELKNLDPGKYYVQIYASERGDAGAYTINVEWKEPAPEVGAISEDDIPLPPRLPQVPPPPSAEAPPGGAPPGGAPPGGAPPGGAPPGGAPPGGAPPGGEPPVKAPKPVKATITEVSTSGNDVLIILDKGKAAGVDVKWTGQILKGSSGDKALTKNEADLTIIKVFEDESTARVHKLSIDQIGENKRVVLKAPPAEE